MSQIDAKANRAQPANAGHYLALDGLRGVAAFCVMLFHASTLLGGHLVFPAGRLAVDFFFMLSGFVLAAAYEQRLARSMTFRDFVSRRVIRLYPMIFLGSMMGFVVLVVSHHSPAISIRSATYMLMSGIFALPTAHLMFLSYYPLNPPEWSLTFELIVSIFFAAWARWARGRGLLAILLASIVLAAFYRIIVSVDNARLVEAMASGIASMTLPFVVGVGLFRLRSRFPSWRVPVILLAVALAGSFVPPGGGQSGVYQLGCMLFAYPIILIAGVTGESHNRNPEILDWLGRLSYPLYLVHWPIFVVIGKLHVAALPNAEAFVAKLAVGSAASIVVSFLAVKMYDEPLRKWLTAFGRTTSAAKSMVVRTSDSSPA